MIKYSKRAEGPAQSSTLKTISQLFCWECEGVAYMSRAPATRRVLMLLPRSGSSSRMANPCPTIMARVGHWAVTGGGGVWWGGGQQLSSRTARRNRRSSARALEFTSSRPHTDSRRLPQGAYVPGAIFKSQIYIYFYIYMYIFYRAD